MPSSSLAVATAALLSLCSRTQAFVGVPSAAASAAAVARGRSGSALSMAAKPDQLPAQAKRYYVRPDRILDVLTSAPQLLLRLGSGALVDGYQCEWCWGSRTCSCSIFAQSCNQIPGTEQATAPSPSTHYIRTLPIDPSHAHADVGQMSHACNITRT